MNGISPTWIAIAAACFVAGALLGWLLHRERLTRAAEVRRQREKAQREALQAAHDKLERQLAQMKVRLTDSQSQAHRRQRQLTTAREVQQEQIERLNRRASDIDTLQQALETARAERKRFKRQLKLLIRRQSDERTTTTRAPAAMPLTLKSIRGIGPALAKKLNSLGIYGLRQIADLQPAEVEALNQQLAFPGRIERDRWVEQAQRLLADADDTPPLREACAG